MRVTEPNPSSVKGSALPAPDASATADSTCCVERRKPMRQRMEAGLASRDMSERKRTTSSVLVGLLLTIAGLGVALLAIVLALMVAAAILPDHNAPMTP